MESKFKLGQKVIVGALGVGVITAITFAYLHVLPTYQVRIVTYDKIQWHNMVDEDLIEVACEL